MRQASRFMPEYVPHKTSITEKCIQLLMLSVLILSVWETPFLLLLVPIIAIVSYFLSKKREKKFRALEAKREELTICNFARSFDCKKIDTWVIRAVYEKLQKYILFDGKAFPVKADDHLLDDLEIDEEDLDYDIIDEIAQRTGRSLENTENNPYYYKVKLVRDLVFFFNEQPLSKTQPTRP